MLTLQKFPASDRPICPAQLFSSLAWGPFPGHRVPSAFFQMASLGPPVPSLVGIWVVPSGAGYLAGRHHERPQASWTAFRSAVAGSRACPSRPHVDKTQTAPWSPEGEVQAFRDVLGSCGRGCHGCQTQAVPRETVTAHRLAERRPGGGSWRGGNASVGRNGSLASEQSCPC